MVTKGKDCLGRSRSVVSSDGGPLSRLCRHCGQRNISRPRELCWPCYYTLAIRDLYPLPGNPRQDDEFTGPGKPPPQPTTARRGTTRKIEVLAARAARGEQLHHPADSDEGPAPADLDRPLRLG